MISPVGRLIERTVLERLNANISVVGAIVSPFVKVSEALVDSTVRIAALVFLLPVMNWRS